MSEPSDGRAPWPRTGPGAPPWPAQMRLRSACERAAPARAHLKPMLHRTHMAVVGGQGQQKAVVASIPQHWPFSPW